MRSVLLGFAASAAVCLSAAAASAAPGMPGGTAGAGAARPVAMCGYSCRDGGRYMPGPPSVCHEEGMRHCGPMMRDMMRDDRPRYRERRRDWDDDDYDRPRRRDRGDDYDRPRRRDFHDEE
ncbi:hypothetical protein [Enterovirga sp. CN4-39]|uniref:hypothetical protein n=1 Tax=Enterovirga sp. CN4-39 TaxID=3400910 RepID=UPI003BFCB59C